MRTCPYPGCGADLPDHLFACRRHWSELDPEQQADIHDAYRRYQAGELRLGELRWIQENVTGWAEAGKARFQTEVLHKPSGPKPAGDKDVVLCRSCKGRLRWGTTAKGSMIPLNADPDPRGNMVERDGVFVVVSLLDPAKEGEPVYMPHHATCPHAAQHRRKK